MNKDDDAYKIRLKTAFWITLPIMVIFMLFLNRNDIKNSMTSPPKEGAAVEKKKTPPPPKNYRKVVMLKSGKLEHIKLPTYGRWYSAKVDGRCLFAIYLKDGTGPLSLMDPSGPHNCMVDGPDCRYYIGDSMFSFEDISHVEYRLGPKADGFPQGVTVKVQVGRY